MDGLSLINNNIIQKQEELIKRYLNYIDVSNQTEIEYGFGLKNFFDYCNKNNITNIQREHVIAYRNYLQEQNKSANTINLYIVSVKNFFKWLEYEGIYKNIAQNIKAMPVESTHVRNALNIEQVKEVLQHCQSDKERLIVSLAITTGIRCNEMCNIRLQDFVEKNGKTCLYVLGKARKGMKTDYVVITDTLFKKIKEYVSKENITDYLFTSNSNNSKGKPISTRSMREIVNKIYERTGIKNENLVFHSLRHSFCNISLESGIPLQEVSMAMRHKGIATTMRYVKDIEAQNNKCYNNVSNLLFA